MGIPIVKEHLKSFFKWLAYNQQILISFRYIKTLEIVFISKLAVIAIVSFPFAKIFLQSRMSIFVGYLGFNSLKRFIIPRVVCSTTISYITLSAGGLAWRALCQGNMIFIFINNLNMSICFLILNFVTANAHVQVDCAYCTLHPVFSSFSVDVPFAIMLTFLCNFSLGFYRCFGLDCLSNIHRVICTECPFKFTFSIF